jgi:hypothetical protein
MGLMPERIGARCTGGQKIAETRLSIILPTISIEKPPVISAIFTLKYGIIDFLLVFLR